MNCISECRQQYMIKYCDCTVDTFFPTGNCIYKNIFLKHDQKVLKKVLHKNLFQLFLATIPFLPTIPVTGI